MSNKLNEDIDKRIINCLNNEAEKISVSEDMFFKIRAEILKEKEGVFYNMKIRFLRARTAIIAGALVILTTGTCVAATNGFQSISTTNKNNAIKTFPSNETVKSTVGFLPKYTESLGSGFKFEEFNYSDNSEKDDQGKEVSKSKSALFDYKRDGSQKKQHLSIYVTPVDEKEFNDMAKTTSDVTEYNGTKIYYKDTQYKAVPENYVKTEDDIKKINEGTLQIGFGSDEIEEHRNQSVFWYDSGIQYLILNMSYDDINKEAMINMAKTVIDK